MHGPELDYPLCVCVLGTVLPIDTKMFLSLFSHLCISNLFLPDYSRAYKVAVISVHLKENVLLTLFYTPSASSFLSVLAQRNSLKDLSLVVFNLSPQILF